MFKMSSPDENAKCLQSLESMLPAAVGGAIAIIPMAYAAQDRPSPLVTLAIVQEHGS